MTFRNEPILELRRAPTRESLLGALRELDATLPLEVPVLIGGERGSVAVSYTHLTLPTTPYV